MPHIGNSNNPVEGNGENHLLPSIFGGEQSRKSSQQTLSSQDGDNATQQGGPVRTIAPGANGNRRSVSANAHRGGPIPPPATVGAARLRNNAWTPGFERAMNNFENAGRASIPAPIGTGRPTPGANNIGRSVSAAQQGTSAQAANNYSARLDLGLIRDGIENAVEQQVADALGPIRLMTNNLTDTVHALGSIRQAINQENDDLHEQNDVLSRQIDLQYRDIQQNSETANAHVRALAGLIEAHGHSDLSTNAHVRALANLVETHTQINQVATENANVTAALVNQLTQVAANLSQVVATLPAYIGHVVNQAFALEYQGSSALIIAAQREAFDNIFGFYNQQQGELESRREAIIQELNAMEFAYQNAGVEMPVAPHQGPEDSVIAEEESIKQEEGSETAVEESVKQEAGAEMIAKRDIKQEEDAEVTREEKPARKVGEKVKAFFKKILRFGRKE
ncbi:Uncharacterized protein TPAR_05646 [Tolypocladium paradoxum]|uniref:Uncharacterized protein n=1 Tax=Tolypocladium paradoxum TaxID=94208 RepID=A0A2S4KVD3_9HYPO|nr:Uncharacterized protein TPAR_05646 [Tolypocladium paradoxum]